MDTSNQLAGDQIYDAISLALQVLENQVQVLQRAKARLSGDGSMSNGLEPPKGRRGRKSGEPTKRAAPRKLEDQEILDYFRKAPNSIKTMATDLNVTLTYAHKRVKELRKSLKRVKEGTSVLYMVKPRRNASGSGKDKTSSKSGKGASAAN